MSEQDPCPTVVHRKSRLRHTRHRALAVGVLAAVFAAGCGAGPNATTNSGLSYGYGVTRYADQVRILNALVFPAVPPLRQAPVLAVGIANDGTEPDQLTGIDLVGRDGGPAPGWVQVIGPREIPAAGLLLTGAARSSLVAYVCGIRGVQPGSSVSLTFRFARAEPVVNLTTIVAPVGGYNQMRGLVIPPPVHPPGAACYRDPAAPAVAEASR